MASAALLDMARRGIYPVRPPVVAFDRPAAEADTPSPDDMVALEPEAVSGETETEPNARAAAPSTAKSSGGGRAAPGVRFAIPDSTSNAGMQPATAAPRTRGGGRPGDIEAAIVDDSARARPGRAVRFVVPGADPRPAARPHAEPRALSTDRYAQHEPSAQTLSVVGTVRNTALAQDLIVDRHAAQTLTSLVAAMIGSEPTTKFTATELRNTLARLVAESHQVAERLAAAAAGVERPGRALRAGMLKQAAFAMARAYSATGTTDAEPFEAAAACVLEAGAEVIRQEVIELFGEAQQLRPTGGGEADAERATAQIQVAHVDAGWELHRAITHPHLHLGKFLDLAEDSSERSEPFTFGRQPADVLRALHDVVAAIVQQARPKLEHPDLICRWEEGAVTRAARVVGATYVSETRKLLRQEATRDLLARARVNGLDRTFGSILQTCSRKSTQTFNEIERSAPSLFALGALPMPANNPEVVRERQRG